MFVASSLWLTAIGFVLFLLFSFHKMNLQPATIYESAAFHNLLPRVSPDQCVLAKSEASSSLSFLGSAETFLLKESLATSVRIPSRSTSGVPLSWRTSPDHDAAKHIMGDSNSYLTSLHSTSPFSPSTSPPHCSIA